MPDPLELDVRKEIYNTICKYPGVHMRELQRKVGLATGSLDYHLHFLYKSGLIRIEKEGRFARYYSAMLSYSEEEKHMLSILRQENLRRVVVFLLQNKKANATQISQECNIQPSNLSGVLKRLESENIVQYAKKGRFRFYQIRKREEIIKYIVLHKKSFLDAMVDNFISAWTEDQ